MTQKVYTVENSNIFISYLKLHSYRFNTSTLLFIV